MLSWFPSPSWKTSRTLKPRRSQPHANVFFNFRRSYRNTPPVQVFWLSIQKGPAHLWANPVNPAENLLLATTFPPSAPFSEAARRLNLRAKKALRHKIIQRKAATKRATRN